MTCKSFIERVMEKIDRYGFVYGTVNDVHRGRKLWLDNQSLCVYRSFKVDNKRVALLTLDNHLFYVPSNTPCVYRKLRRKY